MTLAEFYATHRSPQAIIVPRRTIRSGAVRKALGVAAGAEDVKQSVSAANLLPGSAADKKH